MPKRLISNCSEEVHAMVVARSKELGFDGYGDYMMHCINLEIALSKAEKLNLFKKKKER